MRELRNYQRIAYQEHFCDRCCDYIRPGDMYEGRVVVHKINEKNRLVVWKIHINPSCDYPEEPKEDLEIIAFREELKLAA